MSVRTVASVITCTVAAIFPTIAAADAPVGHAPGQLIVGFSDNASASQERSAVAAQDATIEARLRLIDGAVVQVPKGDDLEAAAKALERTAAVQYAQPNYVRKATVATNDPLFGSLYGLQQIAAPEAWQAGQGSRDVTVAVLDSGIDASHPELAGNLWTNAGEIPDNGIDDEGDGYVDDVNGYNYVDQSGQMYDDNGHGTHVSGTIGAAGNNGTGVVGVNWNVSIMPLKFLDQDGSGLDSDAIAAIQYAADHGARVINASWGGPEGGDALQQAIHDAAQRGVLFVTAAGNDGASNDTTASYPANFNEPNIVSVAASNRDDELASFSNYGSHSVDLAAPGTNIVSTVPGGDYATASGTSMATPHVAGAAALLLSFRSDLSLSTLRNALISSVDRLPAYSGTTKSGGRLNVAQALRAIGVDVPPLDPDAGPASSRPSPFRLIRPAPNTVVRTAVVHFKWQRSRSTQGIGEYRVYVDGRVVRTVRDPDGDGPRGPATRTSTRLRAGHHAWHVVAVDVTGSKRRSKSVRVRRSKPRSGVRQVRSQPFVVRAH